MWHKKLDRLLFSSGSFQVLFLGCSWFCSYRVLCSLSLLAVCWRFLLCGDLANHVANFNLASRASHASNFFEVAQDQEQEVFLFYFRLFFLSPRAKMCVCVCVFVFGRSRGFYVFLCAAL